MISVEIGGVACDIECADAAFRASLGVRYAAFATRAVPDVSLRVELATLPIVGAATAPAEPFARFAERGGELTIEGPGFRGAFSRPTGRGWIAQPPDPAPLEALLTAIVAGRLLASGGFLLHAAAIAGDEGARVFFGPSGSGKTTVATLVGEGVITDEIAALRRTRGGWRVSGVPWRGTRFEADLAAVVRLRKSAVTAFRRLGPGEAVRELLGSAFFPVADGAEIGRFLETASELAASTDCWEMAFTPDRAFWDAIPGRAAEAARG